MPCIIVGSDFKYDFQARWKQGSGTVEYNLPGLAELGPTGRAWSGEMHGISAYPALGDVVFNTSSVRARTTRPGRRIYNWLI